MRFVRKTGLWALPFLFACRIAFTSEPDTASEQPVESLDSTIQSKNDESTSFALRGAAYIESKEPNLALAAFEKSIELNPSNPLPYRYRACYWSQQRETNNALADLDTAIELDPEDSATFAQRALNHGLKRHWTQAFADIDRAQELDPDNADHYFDMALLCNAQADRQSTIEALEIAIRLNPNHSMAYEFRGWQWLTLRNTGRSIEDFTDALRIDSHSCTAYLKRTVARMAQHEHSKAISDIALAQHYDPRFVRPNEVSVVATELLRSTNMKLSERSDDSADSSRDAATYRDRGIAQRALERWDEAKSDLNEAIRLDQSSSLAFAVRGQLWLRENDWDRAIEDFDAALQLNPRDVSTWIDRGTAHLEKNDPTAACADFTQALEIDARDNRARAKRGAAYQSLEKLELAIADYEQVMRGSPFYVPIPRSRWQEEKQAPPDAEAELTANINSSLSDEEPILESKVGLQLSEMDDGAFIRDNTSLDEPQKKQSSETKSGQSGRSAAGNGMWNPICLDPSYLMVFANHAKCMTKMARWEQSLKDCQELTRLAPSDATAFRRIAWLTATCPEPQIRNAETAVRFGLAAVERGHAVEDYVALSAAYAESGDFDQAKQSLSRAREMATELAEKDLQADRQRYKAAEFERIVDDNADDTPQDKATGLEAAINACQQTQWKDARAVEILAEAYATAGKFEDAIVTCEKRHELIIEERDKPLRNLLELYEANEPYRTDSDLLIAGPAIGGITPDRQWIAYDEFDNIGFLLPMDKLSVVQLRLLKLNQKLNLPPRSARPAEDEIESESDESTDQSTNSEQTRKTNEAKQLVRRGTNHQQEGQFEEAIKDYQDAIQLDSQNADAFDALARLLATCSNDRIRNGQEALRHAQTACELTNWKAWKPLETLAAAYAETGDFVTAIQWTEASIELIPFDEPESETERLQKNLEQYRQNKPIRE